MSICTQRIQQTECVYCVSECVCVFVCMFIGKYLHVCVCVVSLCVHKMFVCVCEILHVCV